MGKTFNLSVVIGAALSGTFKSTIGGALGQVKALGSSIERLESGRADIDRFRKLKTDLEGAKAAMTAAQAEAGKLAREFKAADAESARLGKDLAAAKERLAAVASEMKGAKRPGEELKQAYAAAKAEVKSLGEAQRQAARQASALGESFSAARTKVGSLKAQVESQSVSLQRLRQQMAQAGVSTRSLAADQAKLGAALERARSAQAKLGAALAAQKANLEKRAQYRGQLFDAVAMGASIAAPIKAAIDFESAMADVRKVVDFEQPDGLVQMGRTIKEMSRTIPVSAKGLASIAAAGGQLGVKESDIPKFMNSVAKMSVAFDVLPEKTGEAMAKMSNAYQIPIGQLDLLGDAINKLGNDSVSKERDIVEALIRVGGVGRIFGLSAVQVAALTSSMISLGKEPEVAARGINAVLTKLKIASELPGKKTETAFVKNLGMTGEQIEKMVTADPQGGLIKFLDKVAALDPGSQMKFLSQVFGQEWADDMALLVQSLPEYKRQLGLVADQSKYAGSMTREFEIRSQTTANSLQLLKNRTVEAGINFGSVFLPPIVAAAGVMGGVASKVADFAERFPLLTKVIGGTIVGFIGLRVATIAFGYAGTFVKGGILSLGVALRSLQASLALARGGMVAMTATAGGTALGGFAAKALTPVRALGNAVLHPVATVRSLGSALAGLGRGAARGVWSGLRGIGSAALGLGRFLLNPIGAIRSLGGALLGFARLAVPAVVGGIRAIGLAMLTNPVGIGLAVITGAALLIYKYWEPIKSFFGGLWQGFKGGFASAFGGIGAVLAPLQPVFNAVGTAVNWVWSGIKSLVEWFGNLFGPANASSETLKQCASAGQVVGQVLGVVVGGAVKLLIAPFQLLGSAVQFVWNLFQNGPYQAVVNGFSQIKAWLENFSLADVGRKIIGTLVGGIESVGSAVKNAVKSAFTQADPMFPHSDAQEGPFSRLTASGRALVATFGAGIEAAGSRALVNPLGRIFGAARQMLGRPLGAAANLIPNIQVPEMFERARRLLGAAALALPLALQPTLALPGLGSSLTKTPAIQAIGRPLPPAAPAIPNLGAAARWETITPRIPALPDLQGRTAWDVTPPVTPRLPKLGGSIAWRSIPPSIPGVPEIGAAARWETVAPQIPALPDLQARAAWNVARPAVPGIPNLGAALSWRSLPPAAPAIPEIGAAIGAERPKPDLPALADLSGVRPGVESPQGRTPIIINMGDIVVNAASGADGADIAAQVREQVRLALEEARRQLEAEQRGALHD